MWVRPPRTGTHQCRGTTRTGRGILLTVKLLDEGRVCCHEFVVGELACGTLRNRDELLALLKALPEVRMAKHDEVLTFVVKRQLSGRGLGWVDMHLLASALLANCKIWSLDKALAAAATQLKLGSN